MENRVVLVTGAAAGIGLGLVKALAMQGYVVFLTDRDQDQAVYEADLLSKQGLSVIGMGCDVTDEQNLDFIIKHIVDRYGRLDVLVNNAGKQYVSALEDFPSDEFESIIKLMLTAPFYAIKHVFPIMKRQQYGRIINMSSINGLIGFAGKAAYNSAKHGVIGLTKVAALEGAQYGITVNAVCPGYVDTNLVRNQLADLAKQRNIDVQEVLEEVIYPLVPQRRLLEVSEIAEAVLYLVGEKAQGITGQAIVIDGGYVAQ